VFHIFLNSLLSLCHYSVVIVSVCFSFQPVGFCVGEVLGPAHGQQDVKVSCEIFHPQVGYQISICQAFYFPALKAR